VPKNFDAWHPRGDFLLKPKAKEVSALVYAEIPNSVITDVMSTPRFSEVNQSKSTNAIH
jgi:hypothetical protein